MTGTGKGNSGSASNNNNKAGEEPIQKIADANVDLDLTNMDRFLMTPLPRDAGIVQCYIRRNKSGTNKLFPIYSLYLKVGFYTCIYICIYVYVCMKIKYSDNESNFNCIFIHIVPPNPIIFIFILLILHFFPRIMINF